MINDGSNEFENHELELILDNGTKNNACILSFERRDKYFIWIRSKSINACRYSNQFLNYKIILPIKMPARQMNYLWNQRKIWVRNKI